MMIAGPALVDWAKLGDVSKEELGASRIHTRNGAIDDEVASEAEAFERAAPFLSYLPTSVDELPPVVATNDDPKRREEFLLDVVPNDPRKVYKMRPIIEAVVDRDSFFEIGRAWGKSIITGLARLDGVPVALFAEDPFVYGGAWTADACRKLTRLIDLSAIFHLPLVHLVDCPGFLIGKQSEEDSTIRFGSTDARRARAVAGAVHERRRAQGIRRGRRRESQARQPSHPRCVAVGRLGFAADRRRHRGGVQGGTRGRRPIPTRISPRSKRA